MELGPAVHVLVTTAHGIVRPIGQFGGPTSRRCAYATKLRRRIRNKLKLQFGNKINLLNCEHKNSKASHNQAVL